MASFPDPEEIKMAVESATERRSGIRGGIPTLGITTLCRIKTPYALGTCVCRGKRLLGKAKAVTGDDGVLTALRLSTSTCARISLVVLSACELGLAILQEARFTVYRSLQNGWHHF